MKNLMLFDGSANGLQKVTELLDYLN